MSVAGPLCSYTNRCYDSFRLRALCALTNEPCERVRTRSRGQFVDEPAMVVRSYAGTLDNDDILALEEFNAGRWICVGAWRSGKTRVAVSEIRWACDAIGRNDEFGRSTSSYNRRCEVLEEAQHKVAGCGEDWIDWLAAIAHIAF